MAKRVFMQSVYYTEKSGYTSGGYDNRFVSSIRPDQKVISQIEKENGGSIEYYTFKIVETEISEDGTEEIARDLHIGPQIYRGKSMSIAEATLIYGKTMVSDKIRDAGKPVERFCIGDSGKICVMGPGNFTEEEYTLKLEENPKWFERLEEGVEKVPEGHSK